MPDDHPDEKRLLAEHLSAQIFHFAMHVSHGDPGFAGAVLTLATGHVLAMMDDDDAEQAAEMNSEKALKYRAALRAMHPERYGEAPN